MMVDTHEFYQTPRQTYAEQVLGYSKQALRTAVSIVSPDNPYANPLDVFPAPGELRTQNGGLGLSEDQERQLRAVGAELGFDRQADRTLSELGLKGAHVIIEGGQLPEMLAEIEMVDEEDPEPDFKANPATIFVMADPRRKITDPAEVALADKLYESVVTDGMVQNEYEMAGVVIGNKNLVTTEQSHEQDVDGGYDIENDFAFSNEEKTGQFRFMGNFGDTAVVLMIVERRSYTDEDNQERHPRQPDVADLIRIISAFEEARGDTEYPIAFVTGATDEPSSVVDAARGGLIAGRMVGVASYGAERLAKVKGEEQSIPEPISQLSDKLRELALRTAQLEALLTGTTQQLS